jgi:hypothetical protein
MISDSFDCGIGSFLSDIFSCWSSSLKWKKNRSQILFLNIHRTAYFLYSSFCNVSKENPRVLICLSLSYDETFSTDICLLSIIFSLLERYLRIDIHPSKMVKLNKYKINSFIFLWSIIYKSIERQSYRYAYIDTFV